MSIWGRHDSEPQAEEQQSQAATGDGQAEPRDTREPAAEHQAGEPAPAFWRAQGETPASLGRDPADAPPAPYGQVPDGPPPAGVPTTTTMGPTPAYGQQVPGEAPVRTDSESPAGTEAPAPVLSGVVLDDQSAVKDSAPAGAQHPAENEDQAAHDAQAGGPAVAEVPEPTVAVAREPAVAEAQEPAPAAAALTPQRWSEILVAFVDDPRSSVTMAADAVEEAVDEFVNAVRARQRALASSWEGTGAGTEELRTALRDYRKFWHQVQQLDLGEKTGA